MKKELTFYLIRHGRTVWNEEGLMQGWGDSPLTEAGIRGARLTGKALAQVPFAAAYSSCLQRTIDTTEHILADRDVPRFQHKGLNEHYFGRWEGQRISQLRELEEFQQMLNAPLDYKAQTNGGETWDKLAQRSMQAMRDIIRVHQQGNILIVSHGHTLRLLMALFGGASWQNHREEGNSVSMLNTSINMVRYIQHRDKSQGDFYVEKLNDVAHLSEA
ncbi:putative phosphoglycerate mutase [Mesocricetibacter intestinalis]|uniref:Putative phosphoglycerate mutase n=1 Tax=Mesocricetibacter intestinalis TaxID=1521930 RepID=A0A4R6VAV7_9PAST|nr:histidine phosphatase family protein [Mesocricetibacter intestinalis]TDQ59036.1 putative phosphoglycerate mutase [Mesocricetibacter intestinalis]